MKTVITRSCSALLLVQILAGLSGCDKMVDTSKAVQETTMRAFNDTKSSWKDFFTYHPPQPDPLPQTRYCYQLQSDIVCYDSEQTTLTSKLIGYQDGENISWVQPGGGSLGASGGPAVALRPAVNVQAQMQQQTTMAQSGAYTGGMIDTGPVATNAGPSNATSGTVSANTGINVTNLPPKR